MCGILGSINGGQFSKHLDCITHRGPDASGDKCFKIANNFIHLLHRRLSIVDLSEAGNQPMLSHNDKNCIIFNGEIYNHLELKQKLKEIDFNGHSDTETIVNYFEKYEIIKCLKDLNGIFAFAYLDCEKQLLYLARDRFGVKPLYYWFQNNQLLFASEIRPLKAYLDIEIDKGVLMNSLRLRYSPSPGTIYEGIQKVEPGQLLIFDCRSEIQLRKEYFVTTPKSLGAKKDEYKKLVKEYGDLFEKAVERQLMADVEVGVLLSGGLDSALIAAVAKEKSKTKIKTFTIGYVGEHEGIDEIDYARQTAEVLELEHYFKKIDFSDFLSSIKKIVEIVEEPIGTTSILPMFYLSELAASKVKVVLSGQGADEPLGGYNKYRSLSLIEHSRVFKSLMFLSKAGKFFYNKNEKLRRLISSIQSEDDIDSLIEFNAILSEKEVITLIHGSNSDANTQELKCREKLFKEIWKERTPENTSLKNLFLYYDLRTSLADDLLMYTDKITMHFSLECRVPILDNDLIEFIESLSSQYKFNSKEGKIIHKEFAREYLPSAIIERKKIDFKSPTESWFRINKKEIESLFSSESVFNTYFNSKAVQNLLSNHMKGKNLEKQIFLLLSLYYLLESCNVYDNYV